MLTTVIILALLSAIGLGYLLNINIGIFAISFAYLIGVSFMGMQAKSIIGLWPINLFLIILSVTFFFGFAIANGTLEQVAQKTVYASRRIPFMIPFALYFLVMLIAGIGPGHYAVFVFLSPLVMAVASKTGMDRLLGAIIVVSGGMATTFTSISLGGGVTIGLIEKAGYTQELAALYTQDVLRNSFIAQTLLFLVAYVLLKGYRVKALDAEAPPPFTRNQRITVMLIASVVGMVIVPAILAVLFPSVPIFSVVAKKADPTFLSFIGVILAMLFKVADEKSALAKVPWSVILLLCGTGMLIEVAVKAGTIRDLSMWMATHVTAQSVPYLSGLVAAIMSFFSSTLGVVMPTLFPIVPNLSDTLQVSPPVLFSIITICSSFTGFSPFSSGGALALAGVIEEKERSKLFLRLIFLPLGAVSMAMILVFLGVIH